MSSYNFSAASSLDDVVFVCCRPGAWPCAPHSPTARIEPADVADWAAFMASKGVTSVLSLLSDDEEAAYAAPGVGSALSAAGIARRACVQPKKIGAFSEAMAFLDESFARSSRVAIHCWGGSGRAGRVAAAWLMHRHSLSGAAAAAAVEATAAGASALRSVDVPPLEAFVAGGRSGAGSQVVLGSPVAAAVLMPASNAADSAPAALPPTRVAVLAPPAEPATEAALPDASTSSSQSAPITASAAPAPPPSVAVLAPAADEKSLSTTPPAPNASAISFFDRYLTVWVALCMIVGALIGYYAPKVADALASAQVEGVNVIIAALLWVMLFPMFVTLDFSAALRNVRTAPAALLITTGLNYCVKPFTMWGLGLFFVRVAYVRVMPDAELRDSYVAGLVLLAGAPCTAMVFVWSALLGGDPGYTLAQVALNDLLMLALYVPICSALIGATGLALPWATIAACVAFFIVAPLAVAAAVRAAVLRARDEAFLRDQLVARIKPLTTVALLLTLVLIFVFQGATLGSKTAAVFMLAVPIALQCVLLWAVAYALCWLAGIPHERTAPASLIATSNFFELAVAVAVALYGPASGAALATVVGVLVEVPIMLVFVQICHLLKPALDRRCAAVERNSGGGAAVGGALKR